MSLKGVEYVVFDEADRLFEMGFAEQLKQVRSQAACTWAGMCRRVQASAGPASNGSSRRCCSWAAAGLFPSHHWPKLAPTLKKHTPTRTHLRNSQGIHSHETQCTLLSPPLSAADPVPAVIRAPDAALQRHHAQGAGGVCARGAERPGAGAPGRRHQDLARPGAGLLHNQVRSLVFRQP